VAFNSFQTPISFIHWGIYFTQNVNGMNVWNGVNIIQKHFSISLKRRCYLEGWVMFFLILKSSVSSLFRIGSKIVYTLGTPDDWTILFSFWIFQNSYIALMIWNFSDSRVQVHSSSSNVFQCWKKFEHDWLTNFRKISRARSIRDMPDNYFRNISVIGSKFTLELASSWCQKKFLVTETVSVIYRV